MVKSSLMALICASLMSLQLTAHAETPEIQLSANEVKALIEKLPAPDQDRFDFNEYTLTAKVVSVRYNKVADELKKLQAEFWAQAWMSPEVSYEKYDQAALEDSGSISSYRIIGRSVVSQFFDFFVSKAPANASLNEKIAQNLPSNGNFATGYMESMAETFGDHLYVFRFSHPYVLSNGVPAGDYFINDLLVVTISHTHR